MESQNEQITLSGKELEEFQAYKAQQIKKAAVVKAKEDREAYAEMVDDEICAAIPLLKEVSKNICEAKSKVLANFETILKFKEDILKRVKEDQKSHTFTHSSGTMRLTIGRHNCDKWKDTVSDGVAIVKEECLSLIQDDVTRALVKQMLRLLSPDSEGNLKASKALQLRNMANDLNRERLNEGITIIEEAYIPSFSKIYIYAECLDEKTGKWASVPLGMTEA